MLGVITGAGLYSIGKVKEKKTVKTDYGIASVLKTKVHDEDVLFIPRHGEQHTIAPHKINYKANMRALYELGATAIFSVYAAGAISQYKPRDFVLLEDFIGLSTPITYFDDFSYGMNHTDFSQPFNSEFSALVEEVSAANKIKLQKGGVIATTIGPRVETKAEVKALAVMGANLVSMTSAYEITLAHELEIDFAAIAVVSNYACGVSKEITSKRKRAFSGKDVIAAVSPKKEDIEMIVNGLLEYVDDKEE